MKEQVMKKLEVTSPPIANFFHIEIPLTILYGDEKTHPWIFSNFIQLYSIHNIESDGKLTNACFIDYYHSFNGAFRFFELVTCPWILFERIPRKDIINKWGDMLAFVREKIDESKYIGITIEMGEISNYGDVKGLHNLFIYGYNDEKKVLYGGDHFRDGVFSFQEVKYEEFIKSLNYPYEQDLQWGNLEGVCLFSKIERTHENIYKLDIRKIIHDLKAYLLQEGFAYLKDEYFIYGIDCYDNLIKYYSLTADINYYCDLKGIYAEYSHKEMMVKRLEFLAKNNYQVHDLTEKCKHLSKKLKMVQSYVIKYNFTKQIDFLNRSIELLKTVKREEKKLLEELIEILVTTLN